MATTREQLKSLAKSRRYSKVERSVDDADGEHHGYVVAVGDDHVAVEVFHDFHWDGVCLFRLDDVTEVSGSDVSDFFGKVIAEEGLRQELPPEQALSCFRELLGWARRTGKLVIAETESTEPDDFWLGRVVSVGRAVVRLLYMGPTGRWDDEPSDVPLADITKVGVGSRYCELFAKYAELFDDSGRTS